jgi:AcrR family transcriptional regulator
MWVMANYHHGNLDTELLENARGLLEESSTAISIREVARRTGVSHAAAAHHFTDKRGLLTALAAEGFRLLGRSMAAAGDDFLETAVHYVRFATSNPGLYSLMFDPKSVDGAAVGLAEARSEAGRLLHTGVGTVLDESARLDPEAAALASLALVHGFATLLISGYLQVGDDPDGMTRRLGRMLFGQVTTS